MNELFFIYLCRPFSDAPYQNMICLSWDLWKLIQLMPHSHKNLSCLRSGIGYPRFIDNDTAEGLLTPLLIQLNFWCECGINVTLACGVLCRIIKEVQ